MYSIKTTHNFVLYINGVKIGSKDKVDINDDTVFELIERNFLLSKWYIPLIIFMTIMGAVTYSLEKHDYAYLSKTIRKVHLKVVPNDPNSMIKIKIYNNGNVIKVSNAVEYKQIDNELSSSEELSSRYEMSKKIINRTRISIIIILLGWLLAIAVLLTIHVIKK